MCLQLTNRTINVHSWVEKDAVVDLFSLSAFFICFSSSLIKSVTKKKENGSIFISKWPVVCKSM